MAVIDEVVSSVLDDALVLAMEAATPKAIFLRYQVGVCYMDQSNNAEDDMIKDTLESIGFKVSCEGLPEDHPIFDQGPTVSEEALEKMGVPAVKSKDKYEECVTWDVSSQWRYMFTTEWASLGDGEVAVLSVDQQPYTLIGVVMFDRSSDEVATDLKKLGVTPQ